MSNSQPPPKTYKGTTQKTATKTRYKSGEETILLKFPFSYNTIGLIKSLPNRRYHPKYKFWTCPVTNYHIEKLQGWGFLLCPNLLSMISSAQKPKKAIKIPGLRYALYPFQSDGVRFIEEQNGNALIADEMGLGKTIQALAWLQLHPDKRPAIILCPASLKLNWMQEIQKWLKNPKVEILSGGEPHKITGEIIIINYDILSKWTHSLLAINPQVLIADECHYFKNNTAKRTKAVMYLSKYVDHKIALSGTPIVNRPIEIYNAIKMVNPTLFPSRWKFAERYCDKKHTGFGWDLNGASNTEELHSILSKSIMIRRLKKDVLLDLPAKTYSFVPLEITNQSEYSHAVSDFLGYVEKKGGQEAVQKAAGAETLTKIETLKQIAARGKMAQVFEWIENVIESDEKLVIMATHKEIINSIMDKFKYISVKIDGSVSAKNRNKAVMEFQTNPRVRIFVGNIKAAGVGLTLTAASNLAFIELPWTPGELSQAEDRIHRIGQKQAVTIHYLLAKNTIEEDIARLLDSKKEVVEGVLDGGVVNQQSMLQAIMKKLSNK